jgi:hypothetical protein
MRRLGLMRIPTGPSGVIATESANRENPMKPLLALVTLALTALLLEDKVRQVAGDAQGACHDLAVQVSDASKTLSGQVERQPLISLLVAGGVAYALAVIVPRRG